MKLIKLNYLKVENFKNIKSFELNLGGQSCVVSGENATGKTTLADAFFWLISDTNADGKSQFNPLMQNGENGITEKPPATVIGELFFGSKLVNLKKIFKQKWKKKRGNSEVKFCGHTTDFFYNGVPVQFKDYLAKISELIEPKLFRSLSDVKFFCGASPLDFRRRTLMNIVGEIEPAKIFDENSSLEPLRDTFDGISHNECKRLLNAEKRELDKIISELPIQIRELRYSARCEGDLKSIEKKMARATAQIREAKERALPELAQVEQLKKINFLKIELSKLNEEARSKTAQRKFELSQLQFEIDGNLKAIELSENRLNQLDILLSSNLEDRKKLKSQYDEIDSSTYPGTDTCYACGQPLTNDQVFELKKKFNDEKAQKLKTIIGEGRGLKNEFDEIDLKHKSISGEIFKLLEKAQILAKSKNDLKKTKTDSDLDNKISEIEKQIAMLEVESPAPVKDDNLQALELELAELQKRKIRFDLADENLVKVASYEKKLKEANQSLEKVEQKIYLLSEYTRLKHEYIEKKINDYFKLAQWRLFESQVNADDKLICEATYKNIGFNSDLNTGMKINLGLDVINTLAAHFNVCCPVWIDNAESVTSWIDTDLQVIRLVAKKRLKNLKVELI